MIKVKTKENYRHKYCVTPVPSGSYHIQVLTPLCY